jgi:hypothetical protein
MVECLSTLFFDILIITQDTGLVSVGSPKASRAASIAASCATTLAEWLKATLLERGCPLRGPQVRILYVGQMEVVWLVEDTALKAAGCKRFGGSSPSASAINYCDVKDSRIVNMVSIVLADNTSDCGSDRVDSNSTRYPR